jgi:O-antigen biosynthesis protein
MRDQKFVQFSKCPFCSSLNIPRYRRRSDSLWVLLCGDCDLGFVEKYPENLQYLYELDYYEKGSKLSDNSQSIGYSDYTKIDYSYFLWSIALVSLTNATDSLFDLGCSNGLFLDLAKMHDFNTLAGVEYNSEYASICKQKGYEVYSESFIDIDFDQLEKFEVVTAWSVLEHIPELNDVFAQIKFILKPDGFLLFEVPCLIFNEIADQYWLNSSLEHIYYFTEKSFRNITSRLFGQEYIGRVVTFENYGATLVGIVSQDNSQMKRLEPVGKYLQEINERDLKNIQKADLMNYLIFHLRYTNDLKIVQTVSQYLSSCGGNDSKISDYLVSFLSQKYAKTCHDNLEYLKAKDYFIDEIERLQAKLVISQTKSTGSHAELTSSRTSLTASPAELTGLQAELSALQAELVALKTSKFWKLRQRWFQFRRKIGITDDGQSLSLKIGLKKLKEKIQKPICIEIEQEFWNKNIPIISIIIPCYNYGKYLEAAIDSVLNQTFKNVEIIVVDDGSNDPDTIKILENLNKPKTKIIRTINQKLPAARNNGIKVAQGKYICCLDADDLIAATYLEKCLIALESNNLDICYAWIQEFEDSNLLYQTGDFELSTLMQYNCVEVSAVFKKSIWGKIGGYRESMTQGYEDWDFWISMAKLGGIGLKIDEPLFLYRKHGTSMIDAAKANHDYLYQDIKNNHADLYKKSKNLKQRFSNLSPIKYKVNNGYCNLIDSYHQHLSLSSQDNSRSIRILFALPWLVYGGVETVLLQLMKTLKQQGMDISIVTTTSSAPIQGNLTAEFAEITSEIYHLPNLISEQQRWLDFVNYFIETRSIDFVFIAGSEYLYSILPSIKQKFSNLTIIDQLYNTFGHIANNRKYAQWIDMNIVENKTIQTCLLAEHAEQSHKITVIQNGIDLEYFTDSISVLKPKNIPESKFIITFLGRFSVEKCPELFVKIAAQFKDNDAVHFVMCGQGLLVDRIQQKIKEYKLADKINLVGTVNSRHYLAYTNLLILPSTIDGRPNSVLESLSMGVPVIASSVGGLPEIIQDGYNGFLCQAGNARDFVNRINQVLDNEELYLSMKKNAREYAVENLDVNIMHQNYLDTFRSLVKSRSNEVIR